MIEKKLQNGFSLGVIVAAVAFVIIAGGLGYTYYRRTRPTTTAEATAQPGTSGHITQDITAETQSESTAEKNADGSAQQAVTGVSGDASNVGGAYNENNL